MRTIKFIADRQSTPEAPEKLVYSVEYEPRLGDYSGSAGSFDCLLVRTICRLDESDRPRHPVRVEMEGNFLERDYKEAEGLFNLYSRANNVSVKFHRV